MELKEHVKELVRWAVNKGHTEEEVVDLVYKSFGRRNAAEVARNLGVGNYKALLNRTREVFFATRNSLFLQEFPATSRPGIFTNNLS